MCGLGVEPLHAGVSIDDSTILSWCFDREDQASVVRSILKRLISGHRNHMVVYDRLRVG
jgi:hypothetical protein